MDKALIKKIIIIIAVLAALMVGISMMKGSKPNVDVPKP